MKSDANVTPMALALKEAYRRGEDEEVLEPLVLTGPDGPFGRMNSGDEIIFYNLRGEREVQLSQALTDPDFGHFARPRDLDLTLTTMVEYHPDLNVTVAFPPGTVTDTLGEVISRAGLGQVRITETEKAPHLTFFLGGKRHDPYPGEERILIPSLKVESFADAPRMSGSRVAEAAIEVLSSPGPRFVVVNLCNVDVVGHTEDEAAVIRAVEAVDEESRRVVEAALKGGWTVVVAADHGSAERWRYPDGRPDTGHTDNPVPFILTGPGLGKGAVNLRSGGSLVDVAPTILALLGLETPPVYTGRNLIEGLGTAAGRRVLYLLLDGWGLGDDSPGNLINKADTPFMDQLTAESAWTSLSASGEAVGMPPGTVGNSEVGHLHTGAGRVILSDRVRINRSIEEGTFSRNTAFRSAMTRAKDKGSALHLMGMVSSYSSHGSLDHLYALVEMAAGLCSDGFFVHGMLSRRGERPESGARYVGQVESRLADSGPGRLASIIGRYWSLDREHNWDRIEKAYRLYVFGEGRPVEEGG